jgi:hypothetical protein
MRRLLVLRRHVPLDTVDDYLETWSALRDAAASAGARAWIFRATGQDDRFMEFIEWSDPASPLEDADVAQVRARLDAFAPAVDAGEWEETT